MFQSLDNGLTLRKEFANRPDRRPRLYNVSGLQFDGERRVAMPRDFYMTAVLNFIVGLDGHSSYREFGVDARYIALRAKAARIMATYEDLTLNGRERTDFAVAIESPVPELPDAKVFLFKSWAQGGRWIVALGNDYYYTAFVRLKLNDPPKADRVWLVDRINGKTFGGQDGYTTAQLQAGVLVDMPGKEFRILEVVSRRTDKFLTAAETAVQADFNAQRPNLTQQREHIQAYVD